MPYGVAKKAGGDSAANDKRMEDCVQAILAKGRITDKVSAIRICKTTLFPKGISNR
jgi:hypothetical protein